MPRRAFVRPHGVADKAQVEGSSSSTLIFLQERGDVWALWREV